MRRRLQGAEVVENLPVVVHDAVAFAFGMEYGRQPFVVGAREGIAVAESADVALFHAGKKPVEPVVEVVAAALAQGHAHAEADDAAHAGFDAVVEHAAQVLLGVVDERQDGREPHGNGWVSRALQHDAGNPSQEYKRWRKREWQKKSY